MKVPGSAQSGELSVASAEQLSHVEPSLHLQKSEKGKHLVCGVDAEVGEELARAVPRYLELLRDLSCYSTVQWAA